MSRQRLFRIVRQTAAALFAVVLFSLAPLFLQPAHALEKVTLQLKWLHHYQFAGYYAALHKGFYRDAGLEVTILEGNPNMEVERFVAEGRAEFGVGTSALLLHRARGLDLVILAQIFQHSPSTFLTPRKTGIRSIPDMAGKRFMYSTQHGDLLALLKKNGIEEKDIVQVPHKGDPRDLVKGRADVMIAYSFNEPFTLEQEGEPYLTFSPAAFGIDFYGDNLFTRRTLCDEKPDLVKAFREASLLGWRYAMENKGEIADLILQQYARQKNRDWLMFEANQIETLIQPELVAVGHQNPQRWRHISQVFSDLGMLPRDFDPTGIIYTPKQVTRYGPILGITTLSIVIIVILTGVAFKFRRLNQRLSSEILERVQTEIALTESESKYASFFNLMPDMIGITSRSDGVFIEVNNGFETGTGWTKEEAIGRSSLDLCLWDRQTRNRAVAIAIADGMLTNFPFILTQKSGARRHALMYLKPITINKAECLFFVAHDITDQKLAEEALRQSEAFLKESQRAGMIGSYNLDIMTGTWASNEILDDIFGIDGTYRRDVDGWLAIVHPEQREEMKAYFNEEVVANRLPFDREYRITRRCDGETRWVHGRGRLHLDDSGDPERLVGIIQDITERKQMEEERAGLELQLLQAQKLESLGVLAGGIAHDFNNILTAIMGNLSYATMDLDPSHPAYPPLERAEKATRKAATLAKQLLVFAKGGEPVKRVVSLRQIVDDAVSLTLSGTNIRGVVDLPPDLRAVQADEGQLNQSFHNIIINAVHAMPAGGTMNVTGGNVTLAGDNSHGLPAGEYVKISFADEGCGIAEENLKRIFDPYFTTKAEGTGLGLASTYSIIRKHDGQITVESLPGMGTTFTIILPALKDPCAEQAEKKHPTNDRHGSDAILVMDDDEMVRELAMLTLKRFGYAVATCVNGSEAIAIYREARDSGTPFSLVVMDLTIPGGMGGIEAARQILDLDPDAHLIVSSGYSDDPVMANFADYGFCASIEKPYKVEDISRILLQVKGESTRGGR